MTPEEIEKEKRIEERILKQLKPHLDKIFEMLEDNTTKTNEMYKIFQSLGGFWSVSGTLLKIILGLGAAAGVLYGFIQYLKTGHK